MLLSFNQPFLYYLIMRDHLWEDQWFFLHADRMLHLSNDTDLRPHVYHWSTLTKIDL
uniref:Uncharacterized protein n=1 Tax=Arundo donax TaxID=35708 RepID=A0A0A9E0A5_ARUDO